MSTLISQNRKISIGYTFYVFVLIPVVNEIGEHFFFLYKKTNNFCRNT